MCVLFVNVGFPLRAETVEHIVVQQIMILRRGVIAILGVHQYPSAHTNLHRFISKHTGFPSSKSFIMGNINCCMAKDADSVLKVSEVPPKSVTGAPQAASISSTSQSSNVVVTPDGGAKSAPIASQSPQPPSPPLIFAIMRNGHEVIRGSMKNIHSLLFEEKNAVVASEAYNELKVWGEMHKILEEGAPNMAPKGFFTVLDEHFDNIAGKENLRGDHQILDAAEKALDKALAENKSLTDIQEAFTHFQAINEAHLVKEESIMMPHIPKLKEKGINLKELMNRELLALIMDTSDFKFFVQYANRILEKMNKVVVFDQALMACADTDQKPVWERWIQESLSPKMFEEVMQAVNYKF